MCDEVMAIDKLRARVLELLRRHDSFMTTGAVALALGIPLYAADCALESAYLLGLAQFTAGAGWRALPQEPAAIEADDGQEGMNFVIHMQGRAS